MGGFATSLRRQLKNARSFEQKQERRLLEAYARGRKKRRERERERRDASSCRLGFPEPQEAVLSVRFVRKRSKGRPLVRCTEDTHYVAGLEGDFRPGVR